MLYTKTVDPATLELLKKLMADKHVESFALAGGTALSLLLGHRISIDLDFFTKDPFDSTELYRNLKAAGFNFDENTIELSNNTLNGHINGIKVQFLGHMYKQVVPLMAEEGIWLYDLPDIAAMKLNAITNRGVKKDFWDYAELTKHYTLKEMLDFFEKKYEIKNYPHVLKSLTYFDLAEGQKDPICFNGQTWDSVKKTTTASVKAYFNVSIKNKNDKGLSL